MKGIHHYFSTIYYEYLKLEDESVMNLLTHEIDEQVEGNLLNENENKDT